MNREILFRGQRVDTKEWVRGDLIQLDSRIMIADKGMAAYDKGNTHEHISIECVEVIPETIGQFTGITDRNGKKIFEGDIIKTDLFGKNHFISFGKSAKWGQCFCVQSNNSIIYLTEIYAKSSDIIGDLHSNPELLDSF